MKFTKEGRENFDYDQGFSLGKQDFKRNLKRFSCKGGKFRQGYEAGWKSQKKISLGVVAKV